MAGPAPVTRPVEIVHVVVPARDEADNLPQLLASVEVTALDLLAKRPQVDVRVTVVLDSCVDASRCVLRSHPWVDVVSVESGVVGNVRSRGVEQARALAPGVPAARVWIACTDADSVVPPHWLSVQLAFAEQGNDLVVGAVHPDPLRPGPGGRPGLARPPPAARGAPARPWRQPRLHARGVRPGRWVRSGADG